MIQPTHGHFMAFMALKNQTIGFPNKSTPNEPSKLKKLPNFENFKFWPLFWPSKFFFGLFQFSGGPWHLKSPGVCKNHISEHPFIALINQLRNLIWDHCAL